MAKGTTPCLLKGLENIYLSEASPLSFCVGHFGKLSEDRGASPKARAMFPNSLIFSSAVLNLPLIQINGIWISQILQFTSIDIAVYINRSLVWVFFFFFFNLPCLYLTCPMSPLAP